MSETYAITVELDLSAFSSAKLEDDKLTVTMEVDTSFDIFTDAYIQKLNKTFGEKRADEILGEAADILYHAEAIANIK